MNKVIALILAALLALSMVSAFAAEYTDKETVKKVQQALNDAGFDCGTPDGAAGKKTKAAIKDYQAANGLEQTSVIDDELLVSLGLAESPETVDETPDAAEAATELPHITFRGIEFGSSLDAPLDESQWQGVEYNTPALYNKDNPFRVKPEDIEIMGLHSAASFFGLSEQEEINAGYDLENRFLQSMIMGDIDVAGHSLKDCGFILAYYYIPENGVTNRNGFTADITDSVFYAASYVLVETIGILENLNLVKEDLQEKLTRTYGEPIERDGLLVWEGDNDTEIVLYYPDLLAMLEAEGYGDLAEEQRQSGAPGDNILVLSYIWHGLDDTINEVFANSAIPESTASVVEGNNNGL